VETEEADYAAVRGYPDDQNNGNGDPNLYFATMGHDGRFLPTNLMVGHIAPQQPQYSKVLHPGLREKRHAIHAQCMESDYCRWKTTLRQQVSSSSSTTAIVSTTGTIANVVIPFRFANHANNPSWPIKSVEDLDSLLFNGDRSTLKDYFFRQSYGKLHVVSEIVPWVDIPFTERECAHTQSGLSNVLHTCLEAALQGAMDILSESLTNLLHASTTTVTFVHSGYAAEFGGNDVNGVWYEERIWSHAWEISAPLYKGRYAIISDKYDRKNSHINRVGVAVHEYGQVLGVPTLYGDFPGYGLGYFDVMANPCKFHCSLCLSWTSYFF
jgi:hypothetical protein